GQGRDSAGRCQGGPTDLAGLRTVSSSERQKRMKRSPLVSGEPRNSCDWRTRMKRTLLSLLSALLLLAFPSKSSAQLLATKDGPVVYGHHHLNTTNMAAQKKFFVDTLGGKLVTIGTNNTEIVEFPNVLIFFRNTQAPTGGTRGTTVNHIGFSVPNLRQMVDKVKANGFQMITKTEATADRVVKDD